MGWFISSCSLVSHVWAGAVGPSERICQQDTETVGRAVEAVRTPTSHHLGHIQHRSCTATPASGGSLSLPHLSGKRPELVSELRTWLRKNNPLYLVLSTIHRLLTGKCGAHLSTRCFLTFLSTTSA